MNYTLKKYNELNIDELYQILQLRAEVFIVEQQCVYQDLDSKDQDAFHLMLHNQDNLLLAYTRLLPPDISYKNYSSIGRVVSHPGFRSKGLGKSILQKSILYIENLFPQYNIKISAQSYLIKFYESFSFQTIGDEYLEDNIPHTAMIKYLIPFEQQLKSH
ncbi:MAG: GNAT family N-acetyltransferase [Saprospiraceae bacterium]|nr:GNAT family N-acetyltransferase [Candidatus Defluviibacterium haderslevense]